MVIESSGSDRAFVLAATKKTTACKITPSIPATFILMQPRYQQLRECAPFKRMKEWTEVGGSAAQPSISSMAMGLFRILLSR